MRIKAIKNIVMNKKFLAAAAITAVSITLILLQRKTVTTIEIEGDLVVNLGDEDGGKTPGSDAE